jgi:hypothetical protein
MRGWRSGHRGPTVESPDVLARILSARNPSPDRSHRIAAVCSEIIETLPCARNLAGHGFLGANPSVKIWITGINSLSQRPRLRDGSGSAVNR